MPRQSTFERRPWVWSPIIVLLLSCSTVPQAEVISRPVTSDPSTALPAADTDPSPTTPTIPATPSIPATPTSPTTPATPSTPATVATSTIATTVEPAVDVTTPAIEAGQTSSPFDDNDNLVPPIPVWAEHSALLAAWSGCGPLSSPDIGNRELTDELLATAELRCSDLGNTTLSEIDLAGRDLTGADFDRAALNDVDLSNATLVATNFDDALVIDSDLSGANLLGMSTNGIELSNVDLTGATCPDGIRADAETGCDGHWNAAPVNPSSLDVPPPMSEAPCEPGSGPSFVGQTLIEDPFGLAGNANCADFNGAVLLRIEFLSTDFIGADFTGAELVDVHFTSSDLSGATFADADVRSVRFVTTDLSAVDFTGVDLSEIVTTGPTCPTGQAPTRTLSCSNDELLPLG